MRQKILFFLYLAILILPNILLCYTESITPWGKVALVMLPLGIYWRIMSISRKVNKTYLWMFPILFLGAFNIVIGYLFGKGVVAVDMWLNLATTSVGEASEMLTQIYPAVIAVCIIYLPTLTYAIWRRKKEPFLSTIFLRLQRRVSYVIMGISLPILMIAMQSDRYAFLDDMFPVNVCYNFKLAVGREIASMRYTETSKDFKFDITASDTLPEVIVMVIGETSRAHNWQICGYERPTNPELSKMPDVVVYRDCMSQSNTTHKSVPIILSQASAEDFDTLLYSKGIIQAYNEAGFSTVFLSNEPRNHSFNDHLGEEAKQILFLRDSLSGDPKDTLLLPIFERHLKESPKRTLIVVHTYGSHSTYDERYDRSQAYFQPDDIVKATKEYRDVLVNAYDNTIRLTDHLLASFIRQLQASGRPAALLYISDHGEDIFDDDRNIYLHASPSPSYWQLHVPLIAWTSKEYTAAYPERVQAIHKNRRLAVQNDCIFHTLLTLGGIQTKYAKPELSIASPQFKEKTQRKYLTDHNKPVTFDRCFMQQDFDAMKEHGIRTH
ncbi:MAG: sulfatase-like hydrolase/transferase [Bacteroidales bacterium]|nr:sulfatase-like hydrolase/transferase [Candidatus Physcousia equi]